MAPGETEEGAEIVGVEIEALLPAERRRPCPQ